MPSKLHERCQTCDYKDTCDNKRMVACGYIVPNASFNREPVLRETMVINTEVGNVEIYKDELINQIKKQLSIGLCNFRF